MSSPLDKVLAKPVPDSKKYTAKIVKDNLLRLKVEARRHVPKIDVVLPLLEEDAIFVRSIIHFLATTKLKYIEVRGVDDPALAILEGMDNSKDVYERIALLNDEVGEFDPLRGLVNNMLPLAMLREKVDELISTLPVEEGVKRYRFKATEKHVKEVCQRIRDLQGIFQSTLKIVKENESWLRESVHTSNDPVTLLEQKIVAFEDLHNMLDNASFEHYKITHK